MSATELNDHPCPVCDITCSLEKRFGGFVCRACAAFFRRTVALSFQYICEQVNQCKATRKHCRACRFKSCVENAGMKRHLKQRSQLHTLQQQEGARKEEFVGIFVTSSQPRWAHSSIKSPESTRELKEDKEDLTMSEILKIGNRNLLKYYTNQVAQAKQKDKNTLHINTKEELLQIISSQNEISAKACRTCPGVDLLDNQDILILRKYFQFSNVWIESTWRYWITDESVSNNQLDSDRKLVEFINQVKSTLLISFSQLKLNAFEFAAFKAICIWKLVYHQTSRAMKIVAQEHYKCVTKALINYYQAYTTMDSIDIGIRIGEITLLVTSIFQIYHDMAKLYVHLGLPF